MIAKVVYVKADLTDQIIPVDATFTDNSLDVEAELVNPVSGGGGSGTYEHDRLTHREYEDQHPIGAITQLMQELSVRPTESMSNMDILNILNH